MNLSDREITTISEFNQVIYKCLDSESVVWFYVYSPFDEFSMKLKKLIEREMKRDLEAGKEFPLVFVSLWEIPTAARVFKPYPPINGQYDIAITRSPTLIKYSRDSFGILTYKEEIYQALGL